MDEKINATTDRVEDWFHIAVLISIMMNRSFTWHISIPDWDIHTKLL